MRLLSTTDPELFITERDSSGRPSSSQRETHPADSLHHRERLILHTLNCSSQRETHPADPLHHRERLILQTLFITERDSSCRPSSSQRETHPADPELFITERDSSCRPSSSQRETHPADPELFITERDSSGRPSSSQRETHPADPELFITERDSSCRSYPNIQTAMEGFEEDSLPEASGSQRLFPDPSGASGWAPLHRGIIVLVMGFLMCAVGGLLFLLLSLVVTEAPPRLRLPLFRAPAGADGPGVDPRAEGEAEEEGVLPGGVKTRDSDEDLKDLHMSTPVQLEPVMERSYEGVGRCKCSFWFAVAHDILGTFLMLVGVFGGLVVHDLFIYGGGIVIFLSLIWWVFWYSGNIDVPPEELEDDVGMIKLKNRGLGRAVRQMSDRFSSRIRNSFRRNRPSNTEVSLSTIYDSNMSSPSTSSSKYLERDTLSI
ncbi:hypothetical protein NQZ68_010952 [Dissostichus eleginoides]|nr:hypothetical protein NQZ68_010952 [Dissostichus eleginoides]